MWKCLLQYNHWSIEETHFSCFKIADKPTCSHFCPFCANQQLVSEFSKCQQMWFNKGFHSILLSLLWKYVFTSYCDNLTIIMHTQLTLIYKTGTVSWGTLSATVSMIHIWFTLQRTIALHLLKWPFVSWRIIKGRTNLEAATMVCKNLSHKHPQQDMMNNIRLFLMMGQKDIALYETVRFSGDNFILW